MDKASVTRLILMVLSWVNTYLADTAYDLSWINEEMVSLLVAVIFSWWAGWKNNYISRKGQAQKNHLKKAGLK